MKALEISHKEFLEKFEKSRKVLEKFDLVIGIARAGEKPGKEIARMLGKDFACVSFRKYDDGMPPKKIYDEAKLVRDIGTEVELKGKRVLVVDDFSRTGETLTKAKELLQKKGAQVRTLAIGGQFGDFVLFKTDLCVRLPNELKGDE
ncbi:Orotate phosphoribosyltransferase [Candidatus Gugararchaeum adminiculabundum]|nr:Orotate phosphoribosyltransferase [Candidatus Gugararchaeum adminiculabundum]